jgi:endonuclease/exonuclease/phosphatase family metal-dependent hydrolase
MVRLILYNIQYCAGTLGRWWEYLKFWRMLRAPHHIQYDISRELKAYDPDILGLVEVDLGSIRSAGQDVSSFFKKSMKFISEAKHVKYTDKGLSGFFKRLPIARKQGNSLLSKKPLVLTKYHELQHGSKRIVIEVTVKKPREYKIFLVHLALGEKTRQLQLKQIIQIMNAQKCPIILMGDFNTFDGEQELHLLLEQTQLSYRGSGYTQPTSNPSRTLDYVLASQEVRIKKYTVLNDVKLSDHLPVMIDFDIK